MESNIASLRQAIKEKQAPMQVSQTRLDTRSYRPNVELCRDRVQYKLLNEVCYLLEKDFLWNGVINKLL